MPETEDKIVDATVVEETTAPHAADAPPEAPPPARKAEVEVHRPQGVTELIQAETPAERVQIATDVATALDHVIRAQGMRTKVGRMKKVLEDGREEWVDRYHVNVEGWQTLATLLGIAVVPVWTRRVIDETTGKPQSRRFTVRETKFPQGKGQGKPVVEREYDVEGYDWEARVEVYKNGALIGAGESMCSRTEAKWIESDDYAVRGMAATRATSRAIGAAARWIVTLAGYSATPLEEVPADAANDGPPAETAAETPTWQREATADRKKQLLDSMEKIGVTREDGRAIAKTIKDSIGLVPDLIVGFANGVVQTLEARATSPAARAAGDPEPTGRSDVTPPPVDGADTGAATNLPAADQETLDGSEPPPAAPVSVPPPHDYAGGTVLVQGVHAIPAGNAGPTVLVDEARRICECVPGFDEIERLRAAGTPANQLPTTDNCPIDGHGFPF